MDAQLIAAGTDIDTAPWARAEEYPRVLVCSNGKRDICCAVHGRALLRDLADTQHVWESSHIGGHRFAPTVVHVPSGYVAGRVNPTDVLALTETKAPRIDLHKLRGRSDLAAAAQAADIAVREEAGWTNLTMNTAVAVEHTPANSSHATFIVSNDAHVSYRVTLIRVETPQFRESCTKEFITAHYWTPLEQPVLNG
jgi:hypothetical protein